SDRYLKFRRFVLSDVKFWRGGGRSRACGHCRFCGLSRGSRFRRRGYFRSSGGWFRRCVGGWTAAEGIVNGGTAVNKHGQRLPRRVFGLEHDLPGLTDHAKTQDRLFGGERGAAAIDMSDAVLLEFTQTVEDRVQVLMHEAEEAPPHQKTETRESDHGDGFEVVLPRLHFELAALLENAAVEEFVQRARFLGGLNHLFKRAQPGRNCGVDIAKCWGQCFRDVV